MLKYSVDHAGQNWRVVRFKQLKTIETPSLYQR